MKERIEKLIDIYCTHVFGVDRDAIAIGVYLKYACKRSFFVQKMIRINTITKALKYKQKEPQIV